jgi:hypothetical protein
MTGGPAAGYEGDKSTRTNEGENAEDSSEPTARARTGKEPPHSIKNAAPSPSGPERGWRGFTLEGGAARRQYP